MPIDDRQRKLIKSLQESQQITESAAKRQSLVRECDVIERELDTAGEVESVAPALSIVVIG